MGIVTFIWFIEGLKRVLECSTALNKTWESMFDTDLKFNTSKEAGVAETMLCQQFKHSIPFWTPQIKARAE